MNDAGLLQVALSALGGTIVAIGWWIGTTLTNLNEKMERVLVQMEKHENKIRFLEKNN